MSRFFVQLLVLFFAQSIFAQKLVVEKLDEEINSSTYNEIFPIVTWDGNTLFFTRVGSPDFNKTLIIEGKDVSETNPADFDYYLKEVYSQIAGRNVHFPQFSSFNQDVWMAISEKQTMDKVAHPGSPLNNALPNSICSLAPGVNEFVVINKFFEEGGMDQGFSIIRLLDDTTWSFPKPIHIDDYYTHSEGVSMTLSEDGEVMILSLNRNDSRGQNDLYVSIKTGENRYSAPQNLGLDVNSRYRESTPTLSSDKQVLYFSSNRFGNNDIFFVRKLDESWTNWSRARRFKEPINSTADDSQPYFSPATGYLYFSSKRDGSSDIFRTKIAKPEPVKAVKLQGVVINSMTGDTISAKLFQSDIDARKYKDSTTLENGAFVIELKDRKDIQVEVKKEGFLGMKKKVYVSRNKFKNDYYLTFMLDPLQEGAKISLEHIFFEKSKPIILTKSYDELDYLVGVLKDNPELFIRVDGHTDNIGPKRALFRLSRERAEAVKNFLVEKGIEAHRINTKGFGGDRPLNNNASERFKAQNRRVEIKIMKAG